MEFLVRYEYTDLELRALHRAAHLEHLHRLSEAGSLILAGVMSDGSGGIIVLRAEDEAAAHEMLARDPYAAGGVRKNLRLETFTVAVSQTPRAGADHQHLAR